MKHLVTGATGFIGGQILRRLVAQGESVRAFVRPNSRYAELKTLGAEIATGDLSDPDSVMQSTAGIDVVYHCGGLVSDWGNRDRFFQANVDGTRHVIDAAIAASVRRVVHLSSASVYGYRCDREYSESDPCESRGIPYIESKIQAEQIVHQAMQRRDLDAIILRPVMVFGPRCQSYVGEIVKHLRQGDMLLLDRGRHEAGLAYVENVVDACLLASQIGPIQRRVFNIHDDSRTTWKQYVTALAEGIGLKCPSFSLPTWAAYRLAACMEIGGKLLKRPNRPLLTRLAVLELGQPQRYDISEARQHLGYEPSVGFELAMRSTLQWVRNSL